MACPAIVTSNVGVNLRPAPITPGWIRSGNPQARNAMISKSPDGTAFTFIWDCAPGEFMWDYHCEETIHFLEGEVVLDDGTGPRRYVGGDVIFIPAGAKVYWTVLQHVRKLAFFRRQFPRPLALALNVLRAVKRWVTDLDARAVAVLGRLSRGRDESGGFEPQRGAPSNVMGA